jgi:hypothetical protein
MFSTKRVSWARFFTRWKRNCIRKKVQFPRRRNQMFHECFFVCAEIDFLNLKFFVERHMDTQGRYTSFVCVRASTQAQ